MIEVQPTMQIITINLAVPYLDALDEIVEQGRYPSRSEVIRQALRDFLKDELEMVEAVLFMKKKEPEPTVEKPVDMRKGLKEERMERVAKLLEAKDRKLRKW